MTGGRIGGTFLDLSFILQSVLLGVGLAMDAFSVSLANGLREPNMSVPRMVGIAGTYAGFQFIMPVIGWFFVHTAAEHFAAVQRYIPWIGFALLCWIGGKMIWEGLRKKTEEVPPAVSLKDLMIQGVATSIDALSVGFTIAEYTFVFALTEALIIGVVTFGICMVGLQFGRKIGAKFSGKAPVVGGIILILIGLEIFITGLAG